MNRLLFFVSAAVLVFSTAVFAEEDRHYLRETARLIAENWCDNYIDSIVFTDCAVIDGTIMLPLRPLVERTDGDISFNAGSIVVTGEQTIELQINSNEAVVGGNREYIGTTPVIINGRTMLCAFTAAEYLNFEADWNPETEQLTLTRNFQTRRLIVEAASHVDFPAAEYTVHWNDGTTVLQFATIHETREAYEILSRDENIERVEPDLVFFSASFGGNTAPLSWGVNSTGLNRYARYITDLGRTEQEIIVAVLDSGLDTAHPFLNGRILSGGWCYITDSDDLHDRTGHGTHVAGTIVDGTPNLNNVRVLPIRVLGNDNRGTSLSIRSGIQHAIDHNADIINMSLGGEAPPTTFQAIIATAVNTHGITVIAAAGNDNWDAERTSPGNTANVLTVAAVDMNNVRGWFSNFGSPVDIAASGVSIYGLAPNGGFTFQNGTSMAAPHVSAAAAMYILKNPSYTPAQIKASFRTYVNVPAGWNAVRYSGTGILNMDLAPRTMYTVSFELNGGTHTGGGELEQTIAHGRAAIAPEVSRTGFFLDGWDIAFNNVTGHIAVNAQWLRMGAIISDGEGYVTSADITYLARHLAGHSGFEIINNRTANLRGEDRPPNLNDVTMLARWLIGYDIDYLLEHFEAGD
jgi:hypothetical protein